ncbi:alpha/beta hydrolase [Catenulispora yoronensis]|uniref:alpha/beta fold hydrolase n=1 Tax=Catenulispora yoronensis TaxID=450799 RepID=UPI0031D1129D
MRAAERGVHTQAAVGTMQVCGKDVVTYRWGDGADPVLLVHGWQSRGSRYAELVPRLQALGYTPITFDAPGHGASRGTSTTILEYREIIRQLQDQYGVFRAIIANSFGVTCAFYALNTGTEAEKLVAVSGVCDFGYLPDKFSEELGLRTQTRHDLRRRIEQELFPGQTGVWDQFSANHTPTTISIPILVIHDEDDEMVELEQAHRIVNAHAPRARLVVTSRLGHRGILARPQVVGSALDFIAEHAEVGPVQVLG